MARGRKQALLVVAAALACATVAAGARGLGGSGPGVGADGAAPTWNDVAPIFAEKCVGCHRIGGIAPFPLTTARSAKAHARDILRMTRAGAMPPWLPGTDSPAFTGQSRRILTAEEKDLIARWVGGGAVLGSGGSIGSTGGGAAGTNTVLSPRRAYLPRAKGGALDDYHCFLLRPGPTRDVFVTAALVRPQRASIVHHVILFDASGVQAAEARRLDRASGGRGWTCFGGPNLGEGTGGDAISSERLGAPQWVTAWVPGRTVDAFPAGTGVHVAAGDALVMQVHYNLIHRPRADRSRVMLRTVPAASASLRPLETVLVPAPVELPCPQGASGRACDRSAAVADEERKYGRLASLIPAGLLYICRKTLADYPQDVGSGAAIDTSCERTLARSVTIYGVAGHMHLRGVDIRVTLDPGTPRARTLLHIPRWDFHWQDAYYLERPVEASPGDVVRVSCRFDNSAAHQPLIGTRRPKPRYVLWGEGTTDEMCLGLLQVAPRAP